MKTLFICYERCYFYHLHALLEYNYHLILTAWRVINYKQVVFISLSVFFYRKAEEWNIKANHTPVSLDILNHIINDPNINTNEDVNVKSHKSFFWIISLCEFIYSQAHLENIQTCFVVRLFIYMASRTIVFDFSLPFFLSNYNPL